MISTDSFAICGIGVNGDAAPIPEQSVVRFHDPAPFVPVGKCHQRIIRDQEAGDHALWYPTSLCPSSAQVRIADRALVAPIIEKYEWLGTLPDNTSHYAALILPIEVVVGVVAFSVSRFGGHASLLGHRAIYLSRGATLPLAPSWSSSFLIRRSIRLLFGEETPLFVVAFSDWSAGELGTVYQASGWTYLGEIVSEEWLEPNGLRRDASFHKVLCVSGSEHRRTGRVASAVDYQEKKGRLLGEGWKLRKVRRGKYACVAGKHGRLFRELEALLSARSNPYPKRAP